MQSPQINSTRSAVVMETALCPALLASLTYRFMYLLIALLNEHLIYRFTENYNILKMDCQQVITNNEFVIM